MNKALGKGLGALMEDSGSALVGQTADIPAEQSLPVKVLIPSRIQPRKEFDEEALRALSSSIKAQGVIQPLLVRPVEDGKYEIIAGERRWRASQEAGLTEVPVVIRQLTDGKALEVALVENIQRADLNPIDEADGYLRLVNEFNYTHEEMARVTGKSRSHITNLMRLLSLPDKLKEMVSFKQLSMGHARALLPLGEEPREQMKLAKKIAEKGMSVRETEAAVRKILDPKAKDGRGRKPVDLATREVERRLSVKLGMNTSISQSEGKGKITINFSREQDMLHLVKLLGGQNFIK